MSEIYMRDLPLEERFWLRVDKNGPVLRSELGPCWTFSPVTDCGYGRLRVSGEKAKAYAHCVSWELHRGAIPKGLYVLHRCDNKACVNPEHLFLGTKADNNHDRNKKGRQAKGEGHSRHKLSTEQVLEIRRRAHSERLTDLASEFGIAASTISNIKSGRIWRHVRA
jgi:hypothetical protein